MMLDVNGLMRYGVRPIGTALANSVESDLGYTLMIYFDNVMLTLHNVAMRSQKPCANTITSVIAPKQTVKNEVYVFSIKYRSSDILLKNT